jgi:hypothetical protein
VRKPPENIRSTDPVIPTIIIQKPVVVQPVQPVIIREAVPVKSEERNPINSVVEPETIRPERINSAPNNSDNSINSEIRPNSEPPPEVKQPNTMEEFERFGKVGRHRKYEERKNGINSIRDVVLYRHIKGRQYPNLSSDMKRWYEFFYFRAPMKGEKAFNANTSYEQHTEAYERGRDWIARYELTRTRPVGHSGLIDLQARRAAH